jgi:dTDP-4-dehydrorhamnose reductase
VHVSTDYVFDGSASVPYPEDAPPAPRSAYGRTKAAGEWAVRAEHDDALVVRTAWLYGRYGRCFPRTIAGALAQREHLDVVADQVGQPTWTVDVADLILRLVAAGAPAGTYHATSDGVASWHAFAQAVAQEQGLDPARVRETTSEAYQRPAPRPAYSVLGHDALRALGVEPIADWRQRFAVAAPVVLGADVGAGAR